MKLPPLPPMAVNKRLSLSHEELRAIQIEAARAALEEAAEVASITVCDTHLPTGIRIYGQVAGKAIRAIKIKGETL